LPSLTVSSVVGVTGFNVNVSYNDVSVVVVVVTPLFGVDDDVAVSTGFVAVSTGFVADVVVVVVGAGYNEKQKSNKQRITMHTNKQTIQTKQKQTNKQTNKTKQQR
jgi:hypothetical protein